MNMKKNAFEEYTKRSLFFYEKNNNLMYNNIELTINKLPNILESIEMLGIQEYSLSKLFELNIEPKRVFSTPDTLMDYPFLLTYYRSICCLSQKGLQAIGAPNPKNFEEETKELTYKTAIKYSFILNSFMSHLIEQGAITDINQLQTSFFMSIGAQFDGSWRNVIGGDAETKVISILLDFYKNEIKIKDYITKDNETIELDNTPSCDLFHGKNKKYKGFTLVTGDKILFSSEPDVSFYNRDNVLEKVIEVKGGKDKAGALERYGAAKKSFQEAKMRNATCKTILLIDSITPEMEKRIHNDTYFDYTFKINSLTKETDFFHLL